MDKKLANLPRPEWAEKIIGQLSQLPTVNSLREHLGRTAAQARMLLAERKKLKAQIVELEEELKQANIRAGRAQLAVDRFRKLLEKV
jgi:sensor histidine kinase YesM